MRRHDNGGDFRAIDAQQPNRRGFLKRSLGLGIGLTGCLAGASGLRAADPGPAVDLNEPFTEREFRRLFNLLAPPNDEPWQTIPWKISITAARRQAIEETKPLLMLSRSGHPLGCT